MWQVTLAQPWNFSQWRAAARHALQAEIAPEHLCWTADTDVEFLPANDIFDAPLPPHRELSVPAAFPDFALQLLCHRDISSAALAYVLLWRITHGERHLMQLSTDPLMRQLTAMVQEVRRASHKMKAFVRFREVPGETDHFVAWFEPGHHVLDRVAPFFARRFTGMHWSILTPYRSVQWNQKSLVFGAGATRADAPAEDAGEALWKVYYANIFNPARLNPRMMRQEMPVRYWKLLPEAELLPELMRDAGARAKDMLEREAQQPRRKIPGKSKPRQTVTRAAKLR